jgi:F420-non-reducing hydrogenase iron-sulfur subunit
MTATATRQMPRVVIFTCNWEGYRGLDEAGRARETYPADVRIIRLPCLARFHPGLVLKAFQAGADGVLILGCPPEHCHFGVGSDHATEAFARSSALIRLLGLPPASLALESVQDGRGDACAEQIRAFVAGLAESVAVGQRQVQP